MFLIVSLKFRTFFLNLAKIQFFFSVGKFLLEIRYLWQPGFKKHIVLQEFVLLW